MSEQRADQQTTTAVPEPPAHPVPPQLVALYQDAWDEQGNAVGWIVVGWAVVLPDGTAVTLPATAPLSATVWLSMKDACRVLDVDVCEVRPRPYAQWWRDQ